MIKHHLTNEKRSRKTEDTKSFGFDAKPPVLLNGFVHRHACVVRPLVYKIKESIENCSTSSIDFSKKVRSKFFQKSAISSANLIEKSKRLIVK